MPCVKSHFVILFSSQTKHLRADKSFDDQSPLFSTTEKIHLLKSRGHKRQTSNSTSNTTASPNHLEILLPCLVPLDVQEMGVCVVPWRGRPMRARWDYCHSEILIYDEDSNSSQLNIPVLPLWFPQQSGAQSNSNIGSAVSLSSHTVNAERLLNLSAAHQTSKSSRQKNKIK